MPIIVNELYVISVAPCQVVNWPTIQVLPAMFSRTQRYCPKCLRCFQSVWKIGQRARNILYYPALNDKREERHHKWVIIQGHPVWTNPDLTKINCVQGSIADFTRVLHHWMQDRWEPGSDHVGPVTNLLWRRNQAWNKTHMNSKYSPHQGTWRKEFSVHSHISGKLRISFINLVRALESNGPFLTLKLLREESELSAPQVHSVGMLKVTIGWQHLSSVGFYNPTSRN